jgi:DNA-binding response OmpR family regulator
MDILWVENHSQFTHMAIRTFLSAHNVTVVPSLAGARAALASAGFTVVLVDFDLDDGKGVELVRSLREASQRPLLVATSSHEEGNRALMEAGADAVCGKLEFSRIAEVIADLSAKSKKLSSNSREARR